MSGNIEANTLVLMSGIQAETNAQANLEYVRISSFKIGDEANGVLDEKDTAINGNLVYEGGSGEITVSVVSKDTIQFHITLEPGVGEFNIGNIVLFTSEGVAYSKTVLPRQIYKHKYSPPEYILGSRISFVIAITRANIEEKISPQITTIDNANVPSVADHTLLDEVNSVIYNVYNVQNHLQTGTPVLASSRSSDSSWFASPLMKYINDGFFNNFDGGTDGDRHVELLINFGGNYLIMDTGFQSTISGGDLQNEISDIFYSALDLGELRLFELDNNVVQYKDQENFTYYYIRRNL